MVDQYKKHTSYTAGFFMLIAFGVAGFIAASLLSVGIWTAMTGQPFEEISVAMKNPVYAPEIQLIQIISTVLGFFIPTWVTAHFLSRKPFQLIGFKGPIKNWQIGITILIIICGMGISSGLGYLSYQLPLPPSIKSFFDGLEQAYMDQATAMINLKSMWGLTFAIVILALLPAICEETFFRGGLQNFLYRSNKHSWLAVIVISIIFSLIHISGYGFLSRLALGIILGLLYQYSGNIWLNIMAHFFNNAISVLIMYFQIQGGKPIAEIMEDKSGSYWGLLAIPLVIYLFNLFKNRLQKENNIDGI